MAMLASELLDLIFAYVAPAVRYEIRVAVLGRKDLANFSLVHSTWRGPAQKRLQCLVEIHCLKDLFALRERINNGSIRPSNVRILVATLYNRRTPLEEQFTSTMLKEQVDCMPGICEMYIETHMTGDDPDLAMMLANRRNLHALTLSHASPGEDDSEYSEVASDDDEWSDRSEVLEDWEGKPGTKALGDSFLSLALPSLAGLKHLFIMRFDLTEGWGSPDLPCPFNLVTLLFDRVSIKGDLMSWMLAPTCRIRQISLSHPEVIDKDTLEQLFYEHGRHLRKLSLAFPWASRIEDISPVYLPLPAPSPLLGLSNEAVAACPSLEDLSLQDSSFVLEDMGSMPHLERLCLDLRVLPDSSAARLQERLPRLWFLHFYTHADRPEPNKDLVAQLCEQGIDAYHQPGTRPHFRLQLNFNEGLPDPIV